MFYFIRWNKHEHDPSSLCIRLKFALILLVRCNNGSAFLFHHPQLRRGPKLICCLVPMPRPMSRLSHSPPIIGGAGQQSVCFSLAKPPCNQHFNQNNNREGTIPSSKAVIMIDNDDIESGNHCQRNPVGDFLRKFIFQQDNIQKPDLNLTAPEDYGLITTRLKKLKIFVNDK